jgi:hypothetical protein
VRSPFELTRGGHLGGVWLPPQLATKNLPQFGHCLVAVQLVAATSVVSSVPCRFALRRAMECGGHFLRHTTVALPNLWRGQLWPETKQPLSPGWETFSPSW